MKTSLKTIAIFSIVGAIALSCFGQPSFAQTASSQCTSDYRLYFAGTVVKKHPEDPLSNIPIKCMVSKGQYSNPSLLKETKSDNQGNWGPILFNTAELKSIAEGKNEVQFYYECLAKWDNTYIHDYHDYSSGYVTLDLSRQQSAQYIINFELKKHQPGEALSHFFGAIIEDLN